MTEDKPKHQPRPIAKEVKRAKGNVVFLKSQNLDFIDRIDRFPHVQPPQRLDPRCLEGYLGWRLERLAEEYRRIVSVIDQGRHAFGRARAQLGHIETWVAEAAQDDLLAVFCSLDRSLDRAEQQLKLTDGMFEPARDAVVTVTREITDLIGGDDTEIMQRLRQRDTPRRLAEELRARLLASLKPQGPTDRPSPLEEKPITALARAAQLRARFGDYQPNPQPPPLAERINRYRDYDKEGQLFARILQEFSPRAGVTRDQAEIILAAYVDSAHIAGKLHVSARNWCLGSSRTRQFITLMAAASQAAQITLEQAKANLLAYLELETHPKYDWRKEVAEVAAAPVAHAAQLLARAKQLRPRFKRASTTEVAPPDTPTPPEPPRAA